MSLFVKGATVHETDVVRFGKLRFWAERGLIHIEENNGAYSSISVLTALQRMNAISEMLGNSSRRAMHSEDHFDQNLREYHLNMLNGLTVLVQRAKEQGMPGDPSAHRDYKIKRKKVFTVGRSLAAL